MWIKKKERKFKYVNLQRINSPLPPLLLLFIFYMVYDTRVCVFA